MAQVNPSGAKEKEPAREELTKKGEEIALREAEARVEIEKELKGFIEHAEHEPEVPADLAEIGVHSPAQAASQVLDQRPTIVLPLTQSQIAQGSKRAVWDSLRWLAEWAVRIVKAASRHGIRIIFGEEKAQ